MSKQTVSFLELSLHDNLVGYLAGFQHGKNVLTFAHDFIVDNKRPTLSLITKPSFPNSEKLLAQKWVHNQRLHPLLSNLLPEGALRSMIASGLKVHVDNEFKLLSYLGHDLPGALVAKPIKPSNVPNYVLNEYEDYQAIEVDLSSLQNRFSLAGVQMKFSMKEQEGRYTLTHASDNEETLGDWIVKTPSTQHKGVPQNEYSVMKLAQMVGVDIPEIKLVPINQLDNLPPLNLPDEQLAYAIKRFDRTQVNGLSTRIHSEDFAQILVQYPHDKYTGGNYEQIGKILYQYSANGLSDVQQLARRLLVNILLGNGDAHLKNWSVIYPDMINPELSPAYDIVFTKAYITNEDSNALNMAKNKNWYQVNMSHFEAWAKKADVPWRAIKPHLDDVLDKARGLWHDELESLPMLDEHKQVLVKHWQAIHENFRV